MEINCTFFLSTRSMTSGSFGEAPPACPSDLTDYLSYPSVVFVFFILMVANLIFALVCFLRYNSIELYSKSVRSSKISNSAWILYFIGIAISDMFVSIQYSINLDSTMNAVFLAVNFIIKGFVTLLLTYALHHQFKYRCGIPVEEIPINYQLPTSKSLGALSKGSSRSMMISTKFQSFKSTLDIWNVGYTILVILYMISTVALFVSNYNDIAEGIFLGFYFFQQIPPLILIVLIIIYQAGENETGPSIKGKIFLTLAAILGLTSELPLNIWALILPDSCTFVIGSWVDVIHLIYGTSILFFFFFIRSEYQRNKKEYQWNTVKQIQSTF